MKRLAFLALPLAFCVLIVSVFTIQQVFGTDLTTLGIEPRTARGLVGIVTAPLVHSGYDHLFSNLSALPILMGLLTMIYRKNYFRIFITLYLGTGLLVWLFARDSYHVGVSGVIYALASFLFFGGIVSDRKGSTAVSLLTIMMYGGMVWGIFPIQPHVSWESHALGAMVGFIATFIYVSASPKTALTDKDYDYRMPGFDSFSITERYDEVRYEWRE